MTWIPGTGSRLHKFNEKDIQVCLNANEIVYYQVIKTVILIVVKTEELDSRTECGCPLPPWVTQSPHRINTSHPKETEPSKANEVNSAQGLIQGIRSQASRAETALSPCLYRGCREALGQVKGAGTDSPFREGWQGSGGEGKNPKVVRSREDNLLEESCPSWLLQQVGDGALALAALRTDHWTQSQMFPGWTAPGPSAACLSTLQPWVQPSPALPGWALSLPLSWTTPVSPRAPSHSTRAKEGTTSGGAGGLGKDFLQAKLV